MPVTFHSPSHSDIVMLDKHARYLIQLMGHSDGVPGAIDTEGLTAARQQLNDALARLAAESDEQEDTAEADNDDSTPPPVPWRHRAWPLLQMLDSAISDGTHIRWY